MLIFVYLSLIAAALSGIAALSFGDWRRLGLKFAGVTLSTSAAIAIIIVSSGVSGAMVCRMQHACSTWHLYQLMCNMAFTLFHISAGRDAVRVKNRDRRANDKLKRGANDRFGKAA